jgi:DNA-binding HxlR family transcriptional regulator
MVTCKMQVTTDSAGWQVPGPATIDGTMTDRRPLPLEAALDRVGDRWSLLVVEALLDGPRRFGELGEALAGIAPNILTDRLRRLERSGIVRSSPYQDRPTRLAYDLTADGRDLASALRLLADWGARRSADAEPIRHATCGTPLEVRWFCPTCSTVVEDVDAPEERFI